METEREQAVADAISEISAYIRSSGGWTSRLEGSLQVLMSGAYRDAKAPLDASVADA